VVDFFPDHFIPEERVSDAYPTGGWIGPIISLDIYEKRKICCTLPGIEPRIHGYPVRSLVTVPTKIYGIPNDKMIPIPATVRSKVKDC
jgi:hypothetical protein